VLLWGAVNSRHWDNPRCRNIGNTTNVVFITDERDGAHVPARYRLLYFERDDSESPDRGEPADAIRFRDVAHFRCEVASEVERVSVKVTRFIPKQTPGQSLRSWRKNLGLTLRDVYRASVVIAARHRNVRLVMSPSRLSEIETKGLIPNIYRAYTLALTYDRDLRDILFLYGLDSSSLRECLRRG
jgi:hypothetical protein